MQLERVRAPIRLTRTDEVLEEELEHVIPRDGERDRAGEAAVPLRPRRERNVFEERHDLDRGDAEAEEHRGEGEPEAAQAHSIPRARIIHVSEREVQGEQSYADQEGVGE